MPRNETDEKLLSQCRFDAYRASGPGGQKRNKTSSAIRLTHLPSGISVTATESRSAGENKLRAIRRLRLKLAIELREGIDLEKFVPPEWFSSIRGGRRIAISERNPLYTQVAGLVLDLLKVAGGNPSRVGELLEVSTSSILKFLEHEPQLWVAANRICTEAGMRQLKH